MRTPKVEIYRTYRRSKPYEQASVYNSYEWRWRFRAANGRIVAESGEGYLEPRNLVRGLEIAHPGYVFQADPWLGWLLQHYLVDESIPVTVPEGSDSVWHARRKR